jgi:hypothetical protein
VEQEVGGSSPPNCTNKINHLAVLDLFDARLGSGLGDFMQSFDADHLAPYISD